MGIQVIAAPPGFPFAFYPPIIELRQKWSNDYPWQLATDLIFFSCGMHAGSSQVDSCQVFREYGKGKMPFEPALSTRTAQSYNDWWLRLSMIGKQGEVMQFQGIIEQQTTNLLGASPVPSGKQTWVAVGGLKILEKIVVSESVFLNSGAGAGAALGGAGAALLTTRVEWIPVMNSRDKRGLLVGNRSDKEAPAGGYVYGGKGVWTHLQYVQYLLKNFVQQTNGPTWTIGGDTSAVAQMMTTIHFGETPNVAAMLRQLIPVHYGVDFTVKPTDAGFEINIFALSSKAAAAVPNIPINNNVYQLHRTNHLDIIDMLHVVTTERAYDRIEVVGKRIVVCGTLRAVRATQQPPYTAFEVAADEEGFAAAATLVPKWSPTLENDYIAAGGLVAGDPNADVDLLDGARKRERYRDVYQHFGAPVNWDMGGGAWSCACDDNGKLIQQASSQSSIRETLGFVPLKVGFDYTVDPPINNTLGATEPDVSHPLAWIYDEVPEVQDAPLYVQCDLNGMHVGKPYLDWGMIVDSNPNHRIALNHWSDDQLLTSELEYLRYDYDTLVATVAIESDHRVRMAWTPAANQQAGDGSVMTIHDDGAEMWVLLPGTVVDVSTGGSPGNPAGTLLNAGPALRILRNDVPRLQLVLAGAVSRYLNDRSKATFTFAGHKPWMYLLGAILAVDQQGDALDTLGAPVTSIQWTMFPTPRTILKVGYA